MLFKDQLYFVRENMKKNKMRIFMTVLATAMGTAFLIVLASVAFGLHDTLIKDVLEQETVNQVQIYGKDDPNSQGITDEDIDYFKSLENVRAVRKQSFFRQSPLVSLNGYEVSPRTVAVDMAALETGGTPLKDGRYATSSDEVVVGYHFYEQLLKDDTDPEDMYDENGERIEETLYQGELIGETIDLTVSRLINETDTEEKTYQVTVVGVTAEPANEWQQDQSLYTTFDFYQSVSEYTGTPGGEMYFQEEPMDLTFYYDEVTIQSNNLENVQALTDTINDQGYYGYSVASELKQINMLFTIAKAGLIFIGAIAVIIASIGIFNTMTMAVTERAPDIGIMKAIGASPKTIKQIFLLESSIIGIMGATIGTLVSYLISFLVNIGLPLILEAAFEDQLPEGFQFSSIPWTLVLIAYVICLLVTLISGSRPAKKATKIDVLSALRREL